MGKKNFAAVEKNLRDRGYIVTCFNTSAEAVKYIDSQIFHKYISTHLLTMLIKVI